ncbi:MAG: hypothetical protein R6U36_02190 [Candidatus Fermentibacteraceae bacterium]
MDLIVRFTVPDTVKNMGSDFCGSIKDLRVRELLSELQRSATDRPKR